MSSSAFSVEPKILLFAVLTQRLLQRRETEASCCLHNNILCADMYCWYVKTLMSLRPLRLMLSGISDTSRCCRCWCILMTHFGSCWLLFLSFYVSRVPVGIKHHHRRLQLLHRQRSLVSHLCATDRLTLRVVCVCVWNVTTQYNTIQSGLFGHKVHRICQGYHCQWRGE